MIAGHQQQWGAAPIAHNICGLIADLDHLSQLGISRSLGQPAPLEANGLGFLPLRQDEKNPDGLLGPGNDDPEETVSLIYLTDKLRTRLAEWSETKPILYIETHYAAGPGVQGAALYQSGKCAFERCSASVGPISEALRKLGVHRENHFDEYDAAGLGQFRNNDDWAAYARDPDFKRRKFGR